MNNTTTYEEAWEKLSQLDGDELCRYCKYELDCSGGVSGGPNGPIYPPCSDGDIESVIDIDDYIASLEDE